MSFGDNLHKELEFQDIQIKELSEKTGISKNTLDKYLSGAKSQPNVENAVKIAQALGVTVEYLVLGKTFTNPEPSDTFQNSFSKLNSRDREIIMDLIKIIAKRM
ncbi:MAG: helix-turn-helix domain-containing protein [Spirochaetia bacterium]|nr:helix-turn-helix domain-containing protein [Spirochaetia bacterium]